MPILLRARTICMQILRLAIVLSDPWAEARRIHRLANLFDVDKKGRQQVYLLCHDVKGSKTKMGLGRVHRKAKKFHMGLAWVPPAQLHSPKQGEGAIAGGGYKKIRNDQA